MQVGVCAAQACVTSHKARTSPAVMMGGGYRPAGTELAGCCIGGALGGGCAPCCCGSAPIVALCLLGAQGASMMIEREIKRDCVYVYEECIKEGGVSGGVTSAREEQPCAEPKIYSTQACQLGTSATSTACIIVCALSCTPFFASNCARGPSLHLSRLPPPSLQLSASPTAWIQPSTRKSLPGVWAAPLLPL